MHQILHIRYKRFIASASVSFEGSVRAVTDMNEDSMAAVLGRTRTRTPRGCLPLATPRTDPPRTDTPLRRRREGRSPERAARATCDRIVISRAPLRNRGGPTSKIMFDDVIYQARRWHGGMVGSGMNASSLTTGPAPARTLQHQALWGPVVPLLWWRQLCSRRRTLAEAGCRPRVLHSHWRHGHPF